MSKFEFASKDTIQNARIPHAESRSIANDALRRFLRNRVAVFCLIVFIGIVLISVFAPLIASHDPTVQNLQHANLPPRIYGLDISGFNGIKVVNGQTINEYAVRGIESSYYIFGTDEFGRDLFARLLYGIRISLLIALVAGLLDIVIGVTYGLFSGLIGGKVDSFMQRVLELFSGIPTLVIVIIMMMFLPSGIISIITALVLTSWFPMARLVRAETLRIKNLEYVSASRVLGAKNMRIAFKHIVPNVAGLVVVRVMFSIPSSIFLEAFLSFIGIGMKPPAASLGVLLNNGYKVFRIYPYQMWIPTFIMCVIMITLNFVADGLRDVFDPKMKDY